MLEATQAALGVRAASVVVAAADNAEAAREADSVEMMRAVEVRSRHHPSCRRRYYSQGWSRIHRRFATRRTG